MGLLILIVAFAICVIIGLPVAFALGVASIAAFIYEGLPLMIAFQRIISGIRCSEPAGCRSSESARPDWELGQRVPLVLWWGLHQCQCWCRC